MEHLSLHYQLVLIHQEFECVLFQDLLQQTILLLVIMCGATLIQNLAQLGYEDRNMYMAAYDWRLSFQNTEIRDRALSRLKGKIEIVYATNGNKKVVVFPHSMGAVYFLHFLKWVEAPPPMGGGGGPGWCAKHIKAVMNIGPTFLGVPKAFSTISSAEGKDIAFISMQMKNLKLAEKGLQSQTCLVLASLDHFATFGVFPYLNHRLHSKAEAEEEAETEAEAEAEISPHSHIAPLLYRNIRHGCSSRRKRSCQIDYLEMGSSTECHFFKSALRILSLPVGSDDDSSSIPNHLKFGRKIIKNSIVDGDVSETRED